MRRIPFAACAVHDTGATTDTGATFKPQARAWVFRVLKLTNFLNQKSELRVHHADAAIGASKQCCCARTAPVDKDAGSTTILGH